MWCHWHQCWHLTVPMALKITSFHSLCEDNQNRVQLGHIMPLALVLLSHDVNGIINSTIPFLMSEWLKWGATWLFGSCHAIGTNVGIKWCHQHCQRYLYIPYIKTINMRSNKTFLFMWCHWQSHWYHMMPMVSSMAPLHSLGQGNEIEMWCGLLVIISITWCWWHCQWNYCIP